MTTAWQVSGGTRTVRLDSAGRGEVTFTVTNPEEEQDRAVFEVVPPAGADSSWFGVDEPERLVRPGWTAAYQVRIAIPPDVARTSGPYELHGRARSVDDSVARADSWVTSDPVQVRGPGGGLRGSGRKVAVIALVAVVLLAVAGGVGWFLLRPGNAAVPSLEGESVTSARRQLEELELRVGNIRHRHAPGANVGEIQAQRPKPGAEAEPGDEVDLQVATHLAEPTLVSPEEGERVRGRTFPHLEWSAVPNASGYRVTVERQWCVPAIGGKECAWVTDQVDITGTTSARPTLPDKHADAYSGKVRWQVAALDDFGRPGPPSQRFAFTQPGANGR